MNWHTSTSFCWAYSIGHFDICNKLYLWSLQTSITGGDDSIDNNPASSSKPDISDSDIIHIGQGLSSPNFNVFTKFSERSQQIIWKQIKVMTGECSTFFEVPLCLDEGLNCWSSSISMMQRSNPIVAVMTMISFIG